MALLLVMGLPAAGKSSLCRQLMDDCRPSSYFSFDEFVGKRIPDHSIRKDFEAKVRLHMESSADGWSLVVVDDNFYLKSMRRPFKRMARALGFEFVVAWVPCTLEESLLRNAKRMVEDRVAVETIRMMNTEIEFSEECQEVTDYTSLLSSLKNSRRLSPSLMSASSPSSPPSVAIQNECLLRKCVQKLVKEGLDGKKLSKAKKVAWEILKQRHGADRLTLEEVERCLMEYYWWLEHNGDFYGTAYSRLWKIRRIDEKQIKVVILGSITGKDECGDEKELIYNYLNMHVDMEDLFSVWSEADPFIKSLLVASEDLKGIRILNQEPVETLFSFICSANNNIKRISKMVNRLCTLYGSRLILTDEVSSNDEKIFQIHPHLLYAFPTVDQLKENLDEMEEQLKKDSFGYRAGYIAGSVRLFGTANMDLEDLRYPNEAKERLMMFPGVGPKVADCVSLMGLGHNHVVPIDTHVFKSTVKNYRKDLGTKTLTKTVHESLGKFYQELFGEHAGWAQAVIFNAQLQNTGGADKQTKGKKKTK